MLKDNFTIVTGLWDLGRGNLSDFNRTFDHYIESFEKLLSLDFNFCVWVPSNIIPIIKEKRNFDDTRIFVKELEDIKIDFSYFKNVQEIRTNPTWFNGASWLASSPQAKLRFYNPIVMSKFGFLKESAIKNPFKTEYFFWLDGGITNTVHESFLINLNNIKRYMARIDEKFLMLSFPYDNDVEVHGFDSKTFWELCQTERTKYVCRGGFFGGNVKSIESLYQEYLLEMGECFATNHMGTEENFLTILAHKNSNLISRFELESGLIYQFFDQLKSY